ncbi:hypothetical protein ABZ667_25170 [Streptomyces lavendulae]
MKEKSLKQLLEEARRQIEVTEDELVEARRGEARRGEASKTTPGHGT